MKLSTTVKEAVADAKSKSRTKKSPKRVLALPVRAATNSAGCRPTDLPVARPARAPPMLIAADEAQVDRYDAAP